MVKNERSTARREESLSRDSIIEASIALLDSSGESGLTFRALAQRLATGPGAIYWHVANKNDLLTAACDAILARAMHASQQQATPQDTLRALAMAMFDTIDAHPWVGTALMRAPGQLPMVRILERLGQQVQALGVPVHAQWSTVSALLHYILGAGGQNAANARAGRELGGDRGGFLEAVSATWLLLDADQYPFTRSMAPQLRTHDDRADFLAGMDLLLAGMTAEKVQHA